MMPHTSSTRYQRARPGLWFCPFVSSSVWTLSGKPIGYHLCGIGVSNWAMAAVLGQAAAPPPEGLELALCTFKSIGPTENLVAILPPWNTTASTLTNQPPSSNPTVTTTPWTVALLFSGDELQPFPTLLLAFACPPICGQLIRTAILHPISDGLSLC